MVSRQAGESWRRKTEPRYTLSTVRELVRGNSPRGGTGAARWKGNEGVSQANKEGGAFQTQATANANALRQEETGHVLQTVKKGDFPGGPVVHPATTEPMHHKSTRHDPCTTTKTQHSPMKKSFLKSSFCFSFFVKKASGGGGGEKDYAGERRWRQEQIDPRGH